MLRAALVVTTVALSFEGTAAAKAGGIVLPPLEIDLGATAPVGGGSAVGPSSDVLIGVHWASLFWKPTSYEVGVGYVGSYRELKTGEPGDTFRLHGGYLALGRTLYAVPHMRTWVELRGELLHGNLPGQHFSALGGAVRFAVELYTAGVGAVSDHKAIALFAGTFALGVFIEASHRDIASELGPTGVSTGVSIRIPFLLAAAS